jgi:hypothetical protein
MKKDIIYHPVEGVQVAVTKTINEFNTAEWNVVAINKNSEPITHVFVTSKGYGNGESGLGSEQKTSTLRHFFQEIPANGYVTVEPMLPELFHLYNEYWVSYFIGNQIYDKKFIFVPDSIIEDNLIEITPLGLQGILHE